MTTQVLKEGALNDDTLYTADDNKVFSGGYVGILEYYTFANEWNNHKHIKRFRSVDTMHKFINKNYEV